MKPLFIFSSNSEKLFLKEWAIIGVMAAVIVCLTPVLWQGAERFNLTDDYRLPYILNSDYWMFNRWAKIASSSYPIIIIGDSVIWGQYVKNDQTLPHYLNEIGGDELFANLGVDGLHPAAMAGIVRYHGRNISNRAVILHLNPLWMTSTKHDLQSEEEFRFNHPRLVPQLFSKPRCYKPSFTDRVGVLAERTIPFFSWISHLRIAYFENMNIQQWTTENPCKNPLKAITLNLPFPESEPKSKPVPWFETGIKKQSFPWVTTEESFQWDSFKNAIGILRARGNGIFVLVGPFNPYIMTSESLETYKAFCEEMKNWLKEEKVAYYSVPALPSEYYADASHPVGRGYKKIAEELFEDESFRSWIRRYGRMQAN